MNLFLFGFSKAKTGAKTAPRVPKLGYFDGRVPKLSCRVKLATSGAGVVCHVYSDPPISCYYSFILLKVTHVMFRSKGADNKASKMLHFDENQTLITRNQGVRAYMLHNKKFFCSQKKILFFCVMSHFK